MVVHFVISIYVKLLVKFLVRKLVLQPIRCFRIKRVQLFVSEMGLRWERPLQGVSQFSHLWVGDVQLFEAVVMLGHTLKNRFLVINN